MLADWKVKDSSIHANLLSKVQSHTDVIQTTITDCNNGMSIGSNLSWNRQQQLWEFTLASWAALAALTGPSASRFACKERGELAMTGGKYGGPQHESYSEHGNKKPLEVSRSLTDDFLLKILAILYD